MYISTEKKGKLREGGTTRCVGGRDKDEKLSVRREELPSSLSFEGTSKRTQVLNRL